MNIKRFKYPAIIIAGILLFFALAWIQWCLQIPKTERTVVKSKISGYVQTPIGGRPGTSDLLRPTLAELGIQTTPIFSQTTSQSLRGWQIYTGYEQIRADGNTRLKKALKTYGRFIPANTLWKTGIKFDWYRFGWAYPIPVWMDGEWWEISPAIEGVLLDFGYRFKTTQLNTGRTYRHMGIRVGVIAKNRSHNKNNSFSIFISVPSSGRLSIISFGGQEKADYSSMTNIAFKDNQPLPNHLSLSTKPEKTEMGYILQSDDKLQKPFPAPALSKTKSLDWQ